MPWTVTRYEDRYAPWPVIKKPVAAAVKASDALTPADDFAADDSGDRDGGGPNLTLCRDIGPVAGEAAAPE